MLKQFTFDSMILQKNTSEWPHSTALRSASAQCEKNG